MKTKKINKILIANRGEIAIRVMRTCREMGIATVAVYSEADQAACFVRFADEAYPIGPAPSSESYLCIDKIIEVARKAKVDAIHPGYGFLSEKSAFSKACQENGFIFLGPTPEAIEAMGDKVTARSYAKKAGLPMVPGTLEPVSDLGFIKKCAAEFGYPVLLKAAAGGGGKGMRVVNQESEIESAFAQASSEAQKAFGDGRMYLEKYIRNPRHVEAQIVCDEHGNGYFLLERECSMQRRHQKVIEEAPCSYLKEEVRRKLAADALMLAKQINYTGVGTIEFLVDEEQKHYFLEMNTRLQVEHCVTEEITGFDLVRLQIEVGQGQSLQIAQDTIVARGHAIECRVYAEDPENNFMPSPGKIAWMKVPEGPGIRHDSGVEAGSEISIYYDPMIAKLIVHADSRERAIRKMDEALAEYKIGGVRNNVAFLRKLLNTEEFKSEKQHTQFIDRTPDLLKAGLVQVPLELVFGVAVFDLGQRVINGAPKSAGESSPWWQAGLVSSMEKRGT